MKKLCLQETNKKRGKSEKSWRDRKNFKKNEKLWKKMKVKKNKTKIRADNLYLIYLCTKKKCEFFSFFLLPLEQVFFPFFFSFLFVNHFSYLRPLWAAALSLFNWAFAIAACNTSSILKKFAYFAISLRG